MNLILELSPAEEQQITRFAQREGMSVRDYVVRRALALPLSPAPSPKQTTAERRAQLEAQASHVFAASGMTEEELDDFAAQAVRQFQAQNRAFESEA